MGGGGVSVCFRGRLRLGKRKEWKTNRRGGRRTEISTNEGKMSRRLNQVTGTMLVPKVGGVSSASTSAIGTGLSCILVFLISCDDFFFYVSEIKKGRNTFWLSLCSKLIPSDVPNIWAYVYLSKKKKTLKYSQSIHFVKPFDLPFCMKCASQINSPESILRSPPLPPNPLPSFSSGDRPAREMLCAVKQDHFTLSIHSTEHY